MIGGDSIEVSGRADYARLRECRRLLAERGT
jgi:hypothetical protein